MKKKELLSQIEMLIVKNGQAFDSIASLEASLSSKDEIIDDLKNQIEKLWSENTELIFKASSLEREVASLQGEQIAADRLNEASIISEAPMSLDVSEEDAEDEAEKTEENKMENVDTVKESKITVELNNPAVDYILPENKVKLASKSIGRIVLKSAELCNQFANSSSTNSKDLINLALGRTEVFKADVLTLVSEDMGEERLKAELNSRKLEVEEYFEMLLKQL